MKQKSKIKKTTIKDVRELIRKNGCPSKIRDFDYIVPKIKDALNLRPINKDLKRKIDKMQDKLFPESRLVTAYYLFMYQYAKRIWERR